MKHLKTYEDFIPVDNSKYNFIGDTELFEYFEDIFEKYDFQFYLEQVYYDETSKKLNFTALSNREDEMNEDEEYINWFKDKITRNISHIKKELNSKYKDIIESINAYDVGGQPGYSELCQEISVTININTIDFIEFMIKDNIADLIKFKDVISDELKKKYPYIFDSEELGLL